MAAMQIFSFSAWFKSRGHSETLGTSVRGGAKWSAPRLLVHPKCYSAWVDRSGFGGCPCKPRSHSALKSLGVLYLRELWGRMRLYSRLHQRAFLRASATDSNSSQFKNSSRSRLWKDSMKPFSQGLARATGIAFVPVCGNQAVKIAQMNSEPLSLRIRVGPPRRPITRASTRRTSAPVIATSACNARPSRVYSSTNDSHLSEPPSAVRSWMKSYVHTSFLKRAGWLTQLLALEPGMADFLNFLRRGARRNPSSCQSRRTRLPLTRQPFCFKRAQMRL